MNQLTDLRRAFVAVLPLLLVAQVAAGQSHGKPCQGPAKPDQANGLFRVLSSPTPQQAEALASIGWRKQATTAPHGVLLETSLCARMRAAPESTSGRLTKQRGGLGQASLSFVELGDYVAVIISDTSPTASGLRRLGASPVYVFEKDKVRFVARLTT